ncbi:hypothetical protein AB0I28_18645 [Phytomonospora sp. NPDC050363]
MAARERKKPLVSFEHRRNFAAVLGQPAADLYLAAHRIPQAVNRLAVAGA